MDSKQHKLVTSYQLYGCGWFTLAPCTFQIPNYGILLTVHGQTCIVLHFTYIKKMKKIVWIYIKKPLVINMLTQSLTNSKNIYRAPPIIPSI